ncbi:hypothetical protein RHZG_00018 [Rhodobacter phage RcNL1]|uniref:Phage tail-related protein n=1 Tax=Rhodobacter phage RcapNL TaxID=1131316 RepID=H6WBM1_9CAUD|nr:phage tail-related protein [Rhodobacter phage RcapNL]AFA44858.1 phage tail-related protein [Rhodobacter phage RcapNL]AFK66525.1 hypothetical protein RHZG_00018 [Rhodobacter phage RcNL1]
MSEELERITILLQAKDRDFARAMERNNKLIAKMARDATKNTDAMSAKVNSHLSSMGAGAMSFAKNFAAGLAGGVVSAAFAGVSASIRELVGQVADLQDQADNMGFGVEDLQGLQAGFKLAGVEIDATTSALEIFSQRVGEAAEGDGALAKALAARGIALRDAAGNIRPVIDLLRDYADAIAAAGTDPERLSMAVDAFGKGGKAMALGMAEGAAGVDRMIAAAKEAGLVLDTELVKRAAEIDDKFDILTMKIGNYFKGVAVALADVPFDVFDTRVNEIFGSEAQARSILGDRAFEDLKAAVALTDQQAEAAQRLRGVYDGLGEDARRLAIDFAGAAETADQLGNDTLWIALATASNDMRTLADQFAAGEINGEQFAGSLESVRSKAADALGQLSDIDKQSFAGVISNLGALWGALNALIPKAAALKSALPGSAVGFSPDLNRFAPPTRESMGMVVVNTPDKTRRALLPPRRTSISTGAGTTGAAGKTGKAVAVADHPTATAISWTASAKKLPRCWPKRPR